MEGDIYIGLPLGVAPCKTRMMLAKHSELNASEINRLRGIRIGTSPTRGWCLPILERRMGRITTTPMGNNRLKKPPSFWLDISPNIHYTVAFMSFV